MSPQGFDPVATLTAADNASKGQVDPKTVVGVANSAQSLGEAVTNIQAIAHSGNMVKLYDSFSNASVTAQAQAWEGLHPAEQNSLQSLGYKPPNPDVLQHAGAGGQHGGIWSDIVSGVHDALHGAERFAGDAMSVAGAPLRAVQHGIRSAYVISEQANPGVTRSGAFQRGIGGLLGYETQSHPNAPGISWGTIFSPSAWAQAWDETKNGNTQIDPVTHRVLVGKYGQRQVSLAIQVGNEGVDPVVQSMPQNVRQAALKQVSDPKFQDLVRQVQNARISFGRMVVGQQFLNQHPEAGKILSGSIDAATDIVMDPVLQAGKVAEVGRIAMYGAKTVDDAKQIIKTSSGVDRLAKTIEPMLSQGRYGELGKIDPRLNSIAEEMAAQHIDSADKFKDFLANTIGMRAIFQGDVARVSHTYNIVPHLSYLGWMKTGVKQAMENSLDALSFGKASFRDVALNPQADEVMGAGDHNALNSMDAQVANLDDALSHARQAGGFGRMNGLNPARLVRRTNTFIPDKPFISTAKGEADITNFRRYLQGFLPTRMVDHIANVFTAADEGQRRILVLAAMRQQAHAAGLFNTIDGQKAAEEMFNTLDEFYRRQAYSVNGLDSIPDETGLAQRHALLETQTSPGVAIPLPSVMRKIVRDNSILGMAGVHPMNGADRVMALWRAMILDRPGFAVRFSLEENTGRLMRSNPRALLGSFLASGAARTKSDEAIEKELLADKTVNPGNIDAARAALQAKYTKQILPYHPVLRALNALANRAPEGVRPHMKSFADFYGGVMGGMTRNWARKAERGGLKLLSPEDYINGATHYAEHQPAGDGMNDILAAGTGDEGFMWTPDGQLKAIRSGAKGEQAFFKKAGPYSQADPNDPLFRFKWQMSLDNIARSALGRAVLHSIDKTRRTQTEAVLRVLNDDGFAAMKERLAFTHKMQDGRIVNVDATQAEADRAFARQIVDHVNAHVRTGTYQISRHGPVIQRVVDHMIEHGSGPDAELINAIDQRELPQSVIGPDLVQTHTFAGWLSKSFDVLAGKPMNWLTRQPHFIQQYTEALTPARDLAYRIAGKGENAEKLASDIATKRAVNAMIPYIHNPSLRTQFEDYHRNLFPFLFAQRQFLQRWGRTLADSPSTVRKLQLTMNALTTTGIVRKDANGQDMFYYPGAQYVTEMLTHTLNRLGIHASIPFAVPFTGEVKYLVPGLANPVTPSVGPFAAVSMKELTKMFPEMEGFNNAVLGQGAAEGMVQQFLPTIVNRLYNALGPAQAGSELASAMAMQMKFMDANGQGLPSNASQGAIEKYVARVQNGARQILLTRAVLGFVLPATPTAQLDPQGLDKRYKELLGLLPYNEATAQFIKEHPDANAYTVGDTMGATEGGLPSTQADLAYTNAHVGFAQSYPAAFPWLAPRSPGQFSLTDYLEQEATGQRAPKPIYSAQPGVHSLVTDIINARAASAYYGTVSNYEQAYNNTSGTQERRDLTNRYDEWKISFFKRNPIFHDYIASEAGHVARVNTLQQVGQALADPQLPDSPAVTPLRTMMNGYETFVSEYAQYMGNGSLTAYNEKQTIKQNAIAWGTQFAQTHPAIADFWNTVLRPEIDTQTG